MLKLLEPFVLTFVPIFVAVDAVGNLPLFISLVEGKTKREIHKIIVVSVIVATILAISFMFIGKWILRFLCVTIQDFQIAGGCLLFLISGHLLLFGTQKVFPPGSYDNDVSIFPLGTPLITGPAVLTTILMMVDTYGICPTLVSLILNMLFVLITLFNAEFIMKFIGPRGIYAFAKITNILLAAIAVMMIRRGVVGILKSLQ